MSDVWRSQGASVTHLAVLDSSWRRFRSEIRRNLAGRSADGAISWTGVRAPILLDCLAGLHCPVVLHAGNPFRAGLRVRAFLAAARWLFRRPKQVKVIACSEHVARTYSGAYYFRSLPIRTCPNPVEVPDRIAHMVRAVERLGNVRIGMVARLDPIKNHALLIRAFSELRNRWPCAELHLAGDGVLRASLEELSRSLGVADAVRFHGSISDVPAFLDRLDIFCYVTTEDEGMGSAFAEALARGVPCVANDLRVTREVVGDGPWPSALLVASDPRSISDAIDHLLRDTVERRRLSEAAWRRAGEVFLPERVVRFYLSSLQIEP